MNGTGDNVVFDSASGNLALGHLNDPNSHNNIVDFTSLDTSTIFAAASGNDIKITGVDDLKIQVFDSTNTFVVGTSKQVFSLKGTGDVTIAVVATDGTFTFDLGTINGAQSFFTLDAINGETMTSLTLVDSTGMITDFEHYRIDVAPLAAVPGPVAGAGLPGLLAGCIGLWGFAKRRRHLSA
jgi:hypothetical protein